jgi:hypothetical protein
LNSIFSGRAVCAFPIRQRTEKTVFTAFELNFRPISEVQAVIRESMSDSLFGSMEIDPDYFIGE